MYGSSGLPADKVATTAGLTRSTSLAAQKGHRRLLGGMGRTVFFFVITQFLFTCSDALNLPSRWGAARCRRVTSSQRPPGERRRSGRTESTLWGLRSLMSKT